jgi:hypothetical protein
MDEITDRDSLITAAAEYLNREDLTNALPTFVQLAHAKFNRELRVPDMIERASATPTAEFDTLPSDFLQVYKLERGYTTEMREMEYVPPDEGAALVSRNFTSPHINKYTIIGRAIRVFPAATADTTDTLALTYYAKIPALTTGSSTNWLLTRSPDLYLYSTLLEAAPYLKNDERIVVWGGAQSKLLEDIRMEGERAMRPTTGLRARVRTFG